MEGLDLRRLHDGWHLVWAIGGASVAGPWATLEAALEALTRPFPGPFRGSVDAAKR